MATQLVGAIKDCVGLVLGSADGERVRPHLRRTWEATGKRR